MLFLKPISFFLKDSRITASSFSEASLSSWSLSASYSWVELRPASVAGVDLWLAIIADEFGRRTLDAAVLFSSCITCCNKSQSASASVLEIVISGMAAVF